MVKMIRASLVLMLLVPSAAMAQSGTPLADRIATITFQPSVRTPLERSPFLKHEARRTAPVGAAQAPAATQPTAERSWAGRHPAALGAMIGAAAGALVGAIPCWKEVCGDGHGPLIVALGAGIGAGVGAGVGFTISLAQR
jgi:hypothetical protein